MCPTKDTFLILFIEYLHIRQLILRCENLPKIYKKSIKPKKCKNEKTLMNKIKSEDSDVKIKITT